MINKKLLFLSLLWCIGESFCAEGFKVFIRPSLDQEDVKEVGKLIDEAILFAGNLYNDLQQLPDREEVSLHVTLENLDGEVSVKSVCNGISKPLGRVKLPSKDGTDDAANSDLSCAEAHQAE